MLVLLFLTKMLHFVKSLKSAVGIPENKMSSLYSTEQ